MPDREGSGGCLLYTSYKEYGYIEDHFARLNTVLTRGKPVVNIGVIHPIESYWLHWGPGDTGGARRQVLEERFRDLTHWLLQGCLLYTSRCV